ncbi:DUF3240 family protein [Undibacterium sp. JH2W]|uniref:DUF3240 family protein n=1 Tax=Undibacterium sp. JH2W TaxID=3413037 RepID=UPI003BF3D9FA
MSELCFSLLCPARLEEKLLDSLLVLPGIQLLISTPAAAYGMQGVTLNAREQVMGHALMTLVQVLLPIHGKQAMLALLQQEFAGAGLHYWISPVVETGEIL